jgi:calpain-12
MTDSMHKNHPMVAGTSSRTENDLVAGHAYTILGTLALHNPDGSLKVKLVKMRNPWGKFEYDGPWC